MMLMMMTLCVVVSVGRLKVYPFYMLVTPPGNGTILSSDGFDVGHDIIRNLTQVEGSRKEDFNTVFYGDSTVRMKKGK